jgi:hypothetical protein
MRISEQTKFPHPVLSPESKDYLEGEFAVNLTVTEFPEIGKVFIQYDVLLREANLQSLISNKQAVIAIFVICGRTYYDKLHRIKIEGGKIEFNKGELRETVTVRPIICATKAIDKFPGSNLHEEFGRADWSFKPADVLAIGVETVISVGFQKLAKMETIFDLAITRDIPDGVIQVFLEASKIQIQANKNIFASIHKFREGGAEHQAALLNGVYLPAVMQVLNLLSDGDSRYESYRWFEVFTAKCKHMRINTREPDLLKDAQSLLHSPLLELLARKELVE